MADQQNSGVRSLDRFLIGEVQRRQLYAPLHYSEPSDLALSDYEEPDSPKHKLYSTSAQTTPRNRKHKVQKKKDGKGEGDAMVEDLPDQPKSPDKKSDKEATIEVQPPRPRRERTVRTKDDNSGKDNNSSEDDDPEQDSDYAKRRRWRPRTQRTAGASGHGSSSRAAGRRRGRSFSEAETRYMIFMSAYKQMTVHEIAQAGTYEFGTAAVWQDGEVHLRLRCTGRDDYFKTYRRKVQEARDAGRVPAVKKELKDEMKAWLRHLGKDWKPGREEALLSSLSLNDTARSDLA
jgi:hypothetical protein